VGEGVHPGELVGRIPHDLRRSAARDLRRAGVSEGEIMKLCGLAHALDLRPLQHHRRGRPRGRRGEAIQRQRYGKETAC